jgi:hypothetical protein
MSVSLFFLGNNLKMKIIKKNKKEEELGFMKNKYVNKLNILRIRFSFLYHFISRLFYATKKKEVIW